MKAIGIIGGIFLCLTACLSEKYKGEDCLRKVDFVMKDVPYVFVNDEAVSYRPYYTFIEQLKLYSFVGEQADQYFSYDFAYCRTHAVITENLNFDSHTAFFVANLYDSKELKWEFKEGEMNAIFSIVDFEEPPVLLAAKAKINGGADSLPVELRMLVSRLEIRLVNPPAWLRGLDILVKNVSATVSDTYELRDTTHITKKIFFDNSGPGTYRFGVNTFPTHAGKEALVNIQPIGISEAAPILVEDDRLHLLPGVVTRVDIIYNTDGKITIAIEIEGKWEVIDGGNIII